MSEAIAVPIKVDLVSEAKAAIIALAQQGFAVAQVQVASGTTEVKYVPITSGLPPVFYSVPIIISAKVPVGQFYLIVQAAS